MKIRKIRIRATIEEIVCIAKTALENALDNKNITSMSQNFCGSILLKFFDLYDNTLAFYFHEFHVDGYTIIKMELVFLHESRDIWLVEIKNDHKDTDWVNNKFPNFEAICAHVGAKVLEE